MRVCVLAMDFEFILRVAERRLRATLGQAEPGKVLLTLETLEIEFYSFCSSFDKFSSNSVSSLETWLIKKYFRY